MTKARSDTAHQNKSARIDQKLTLQGTVVSQRVVETTAGRYMLGHRNCLLHVNLPYETINKLMTKKEISKVIDAVYRHCGQKETVMFL